MAITAPKSNDTNLSDLLASIHKGETQLPDFQRKWTWDDGRIRGLLASLSQGYPMGALMQLEYGGDEVRFKYRPIEGAPESGDTPRYLVMDGQQRLTSMYRSLYAKDPVATTNDKHQPLRRYYYLDMKACLDPEADRLDAILSVPDDRKVNNMARDFWTRLDPSKENPLSSPVTERKGGERPCRRGESRTRRTRRSSSRGA